MRSKIARSLLAAAVVVAAPLTFMAPAAQAHSSGPGGSYYAAWDSSYYVYSAFKPSNDSMWVYDNRYDSASAGIEWITEGRGGECINSHGYQTWHGCVFDFREEATVYWRPFTQNLSSGGPRNYLVPPGHYFYGLNNG